MELFQCSISDLPRNGLTDVFRISNVSAGNITLGCGQRAAASYGLNRPALRSWEPINFRTKLLHHRIILFILLRFCNHTGRINREAGGLFPSIFLALVLQVQLLIKFGPLLTKLKHADGHTQLLDYALQPAQERTKCTL